MNKSVQIASVRCRTKIALLSLGFLSVAQLGFGRVELAPCKNNYTPQQQIELGQKAVQQVYAQMPVLPDSSPVTQYVAQLGRKLTAQAPGYRWPFNFHVANVAEINAFALPGGSIFVNLGTVQAAADEAQLAGVMAHEISHVVLQHSVCNAARQQKVGLIAGLGQVAAGVLLGGAAGNLASEGIGLGTGLGFLKMSREAEQQADLMGAGIAYDAGYDPHGMSQFFETIQAKYGAGGAQFLSDHPNPGNRTEYVAKEINTFPPKSNYITNTPAFQQIHSEVAGMHAFTSREISTGAWKRQSPNQVVSNGVNDIGGAAVAGAPASIDMNTAGTWKSFRGNSFTVSVPPNWQAYGNQDSAMLAPSGGIARSSSGGAGNLVFGTLTDRYRLQGRMTTGAAVESLIDEITRDNPGLQRGSMSNISNNGSNGGSVECNNPSGNNGRGEHDWIVAFPQSDGALRYFVFVAPSPEFDSARPTFQRILTSLNVR